jgi:hypothetical protein
MIRLACLALALLALPFEATAQKCDEVREYYETIMTGKARTPPSALPPDQKALRESSCPYGKEGVPPDIPRIDEAMAREAVLVYVPRTLMKLRVCEVGLPERRGSLEKAWGESWLSRIDLPELRPLVEEVRGWLAKDLASLPAPKPGPNDAQNRANCDRELRSLKRVESALPPGFVAKYRR